jgi:hypothetical protein
MPPLLNSTPPPVVIIAPTERYIYELDGVPTDEDGDYPISIGGLCEFDERHKLPSVLIMFNRRSNTLYSKETFSYEHANK